MSLSGDMFDDDYSEALLSVLVDNHYEALIKQATHYIPKRLRRIIDPEDVVHEACASVLEKTLTWDDDEDFWRAVGRNLQRRACDRIRRASARRRGGGLVVVSQTEASKSKEHLLNSLICPSDTPSREAIKKEDAVAVDEAMAGLPEKAQTALRMRYGEHTSYSDIATALGVSRVTSTKILIQGLAMLRRSMRLPRRSAGAESVTLPPAVERSR